MKYSWEVRIFPRAFCNNSLCKIWGANRVHYGELENRELLIKCNKGNEGNKKLDPRIYAEVRIFPRAFCNNSLCKIWGANRVHYGELENRELLIKCNKGNEGNKKLDPRIYADFHLRRGNHYFSHRHNFDFERASTLSTV